MKLVKVIFAIFFVFTLSVNAQTLVSKSASALAVGTYDENGKFSTTDFTLRFGAELKNGLYEGASFSVRAAYCTNEKNFLSFWFDQNITETISARVGYFGRPIAFLNRPNPVSAGAHYEFSSTTIIPGSATGFLVSNKMLYGASYFGVYYDQANNVLEYNFGATYKNEDFDVRAGWLVSSERKGIAASIKHKLFNVSAYYDASKNYSGYVEVYTGFVDPYVNIIRDYKNKTDLDFEVGITKSFTLDTYQKGANYLVGLGYNTVTKTGNIYFWLYIE